MPARALPGFLRRGLGPREVQRARRLLQTQTERDDGEDAQRRLGDAVVGPRAGGEPQDQGHDDAPARAESRGVERHGDGQNPKREEHAHQGERAREPRAAHLDGG